LNGEEGGKKILMQNRDSVVTVPFPLGEVDIDTAADADALNGK
jgi:molybdenum cofactor cytidylyltransferase